MENPVDKFIKKDDFRDEISTVDKSGNRIWVYPKKPKGQFYDYRKYLSYILLVVLFGLPFIKMNGEPFVLFNVPESTFIIFGVYFAPQDFHLFVIAMLIGLIFIVLFTVIFGRLFCGWICPQTIFMEMVFRRIEYWIEGDSNAQKRLNKAPWTTEKTIKKIGKQLIFILISAVIAHTFLSYIIGVDQVWKIVTDPVNQHWSGFVAMVVFTFVFYGVFSVMREQVCTTICPYGRLQGVLLDDNSLTVAYDFVRGEPRGKLSKKRKSQQVDCSSDKSCAGCKTGTTPCHTPPPPPPPKGDCIDCGLCVQVCPTGIDIRHGVQLECINCTACMDACDEVMVKIKKPTGLVRIDSHNGILEKRNSLWNTRVAAYSLVLVALIGLESFLFISRSSVETLFLRTPGMLYQDNKDGFISNLYNYQLINKTDQEIPITFESDDLEGIEFEVIGHKDPITKKNGITEGAVFIKIPKSNLKGRKTKLHIKVLSNGELIDEANTTFLGPIK
ncbi:MAG: 4Fe-4S dicluster domain-containing protein [Saprospiraceae bacterium]